MKIWRTRYHHRDDGLLLFWNSTRKNANECLSRCRAENGPEMGPADVTAVDVPTDKEGLIHWLNTNFRMDNG